MKMEEEAFQAKFRDYVKKLLDSFSLPLSFL